MEESEGEGEEREGEEGEGEEEQGKTEEGEEESGAGEFLHKSHPGEWHGSPFCSDKASRKTSALQSARSAEAAAGVLPRLPREARPEVSPPPQAMSSAT